MRFYLDWIDGWDCELVHTSTGYVEKDCIFTTDESNVLGAGLWIVTGHEPNEMLDVVIVGDSVIEHFTIHLTDNRDGTSTGRWDMTFTALNETGDNAVAAISEDDPALERAIDGLAHFLQAGEMLEG